MSTEAKARAIAAKVSGLREDEVDAAVTAYRSALADLHDEPEWQVVLHILGACTCHADGTKVEMHFAGATKKRPSERLYVYKGVPYETFGEARAVELAEQAKFAVRSI